MNKYLFLFLIACYLGACQKQEKTLKVAATPVPHAEILNLIKPDLKERGISLEIIEMDDYNLPNRLLAEKQVEANFFQHEPFLKEQENEFGYHFFTLVCVHIEPLGIYSKRITSLHDLSQGGWVAIPNDPTNEARALDLLVQEGLITLNLNKNVLATVSAIQENPKKLRFHEVDAALLPRILPDVDIAVIPANFALQAHLLPAHDALLLESGYSPYANIVVAREGEEDREEFKFLKEALTSEKVRNYLIQTYQGAIQPCR